MGQEKVAPHWPTRAGVVAATVTETGALVVELLLTSRAMAVRVWGPCDDTVVSQTTEYGADVTSAPTGWPSTKNLTPAMPTLSDAVAATVTRLNTVEPAAGALMATLGGVGSSGGVPPTAGFISAWISPALSAPVYSRTSSLIPCENCPPNISPPHFIRF